MPNGFPSNRRLRRNRIGAIEAREARVLAALELLTQRGVSKARANRTRRDVGATLGEMKKLAASSVLAETDRARFSRKISALQTRYHGLKATDLLVDPLESMPKTQRSVYRNVFDLIYDCSASKTVAKALVDRIADRLAGQLGRTKQRLTRRKKKRGKNK